MCARDSIQSADAKVSLQQNYYRKDNIQNEHTKEWKRCEKGVLCSKQWQVFQVNIDQGKCLNEPL